MWNSLTQEVASISLSVFQQQLKIQLLHPATEVKFCSTAFRAFFPLAVVFAGFSWGVAVLFCIILNELLCLSIAVVLIWAV